MEIELRRGLGGSNASKVYINNLHYATVVVLPPPSANSCDWQLVNDDDWRNPGKFITWQEVAKALVEQIRKDYELT